MIATFFIEQPKLARFVDFCDEQEKILVIPKRGYYFHCEASFIDEKECREFYDNWNKIYEI